MLSFSKNRGLLSVVFVAVVGFMVSTVQAAAETEYFVIESAFGNQAELDIRHNHTEQERFKELTCTKLQQYSHQ